MLTWSLIATSLTCLYNPSISPAHHLISTGLSNMPISTIVIHLNPNQGRNSINTPLYTCQCPRRYWWPRGHIDWKHGYEFTWTQMSIDHKSPFYTVIHDFLKCRFLSFTSLSMSWECSAVMWFVVPTSDSLVQNNFTLNICILTILTHAPF